jgi:FtsZ-interacting cell division protein ZipA
MKKILLIIGFVAIAGIILFTASFFTKKPAGKIGNKVDQAIEKIKDEGETSLKNAGKKIKKTAKDIKRDIENR